MLHKTRDVLRGSGIELSGGEKGSRPMKTSLSCRMVI